MADYIPGGFILLARKTQDNDVLAAGPPLYTKLWVWMLMQAFWKNGDKYSRGQFRTTIREMREAMSWKVGYRKYLPKVCHIRRAYEAFTKSTMISTTKSTRGMVITICNYDKYQNPKNYEEHSEEHDGGTTKSTTVAQDREEGEYKKKEEGKKQHVSGENILAKEILEYLNDAVGGKYKPVDGTLRPIIARLKEGYTFDDFCQVIRGQMKDRYFLENPKFLRPSTLFGSKFAGYLQAAPKLEILEKVGVKGVRTGMALQNFLNNFDDEPKAFLEVKDDERGQGALCERNVRNVDGSGGGET